MAEIHKTPSPFERASSNGGLPRQGSAEPPESNAPSGEPLRKKLSAKRTASFSDLSRQGSNPMKMGVPKRVPSVHSQVEGKCRELGGDKAIHSVLVANNGIAAVKFMRSIRSWAYKTFGNERAVALVAMATPEDMRVDAEHIRMADQFVEVTGGSNNNNYANVSLIVQVADRANVDAVWPGWGHASEKPELPSALAETPSEIRFLGPGATAMAALGDKIGSTILAQAADVPTIPWSGTGVKIDFESCQGDIPPDIYDMACIHNAEEALISCKKIGFPIMLKASWGGGGKGIRKVLSEDDVVNAFKQVQGEIPGSPIFAMKLAPPSRHLEVQLLADKHGQVCSVFSRDCSVQRRHQKIVEEGPVTKASPETLKHMEKAARALAKSVKYVGAATVEYLYTLEDRKFFFLELNPRLQVEHPVTEWISGVNIPSCQLMIGMGVPLHRIPDIRRLYGLDPNGDSPIDFDKDPQIAPSGHVVAVRITSEDANDGFKPTCGSIDELSFRTSPDVWGYFSVKSGGGIHEFSDSQFGHLFAKGDTREAAIRAMVVALKEVKIRGEIRTIVDYAVEMIQSPDFVNNNIHTGWLDSRIASHVKAEKPAWYLAVISGALLQAQNYVESLSTEYLGYLEKGQLPPARLTLTSFEGSLVLDGMKYSFGVSRRGPASYRILLGKNYVDVVCRKLNDGGLLIQVDGQSHVVHSEEETIGTRLTIDSLICLLANESDPSRLCAMSPGKLMRYLVEDGSHVVGEQQYAEVEVMKMIMPLLAPAGGKIHFELPEGSVMNSGDLIATMDLDDPEAITKATPYTGGFPELGPPIVHSEGVDHRFKEAYTGCKNVMAGYEHPVDHIVEELLTCLDDPALAHMQFSEVFAVQQTRIPVDLANKIEKMMGAHEKQLLAHDPNDEEKHAPDFPGQEIADLITQAISAAPVEDKANIQTQTAPLMNVAHAHLYGKEAFARGIANELIEDFLIVEERFAKSGLTEQETIDLMRTEFSKNLSQVVEIVQSHQGLPLKVDLVCQIMNALVLPAPEHYRNLLRRLAALGPSCTEASLRAQQLLEHSLLSELRSIVARALSGLDMFAGSGLSELELLATESSVDLVKDPTTLTRRQTLAEGLLAGLQPMATLPATQVENKIKLLVEAAAAVEEACASLAIADSNDSNVGAPMSAILRKNALLTYLRRIYYPFMVRDPEVHTLRGLQCIIWVHQHPQVAGTQAARNVLGAAVVIDSLDLLPAALDAVEEVVVAASLQGTQRGTLHVVLTKIGAAGLRLTPAESSLLKNAENAVTNYQPGTAATDNLITIDPRPTAAAVTAAVRAITQQLREAGYEYVSVLHKAGGLAPLRVGCRLVPDKEEVYFPDILLSAVEPSTADLLELSRLSGFNGKLQYFPSRNRQYHTWMGYERKDPRSMPLKRAFVRALVRQLGGPIAGSSKGSAGEVATAAVQSLEQRLVEAVGELERLALNSTKGSKDSHKADWAHIYLSVLPTLPLGSSADEAAVIAALKAGAASITSKHSTLLRKAAVAQWEIRFRVTDSTGAWRLVASSPTGHETGDDNIQIYREVVDGAKIVYASRPVGVEPGPLDKLPVSTVIPPLEDLQCKRLAARRHKTTYVYDYPSVFTNALKGMWIRRSEAGEPGHLPKDKLVEAEELVMPADATYSQKVDLQTVSRPIGQNNVGIVAWVLTMKTPECPEGRKVVAIANDITYNSGSFGPKEDAAFRAATEYALDRKLPVVYLAANSGARVGLANEVKSALQVEWSNPDDPSKGFKYLFLSEEDYSRITTKYPAALVAEAINERGEKRWKITDVVGSEDGLGVECLSGSGAIASIYAKAFKEGFTITLVSGRTVGIGAYLARLGRRCVQRTDQPIILTGYAALNKLLGRDVYTSHMQLGGPKVMGVNGVSHFVVEDDYAGVTEVLTWLSFVPATVGGPLLTLATKDPVNRAIAYTPVGSEKVDPRAAVGGRVVDGKWESGLFDEGSWREAQSGWARSVVTGRARLGGIPVGVIAVETQTVLLNIPADPGAPDSAERFIPQAGQVWFPDSALKTAHAMEEFDLEGLPLLVLANWRGFSGGQRDLFEGVLQAGSLIVESLRSYRQPAFIYLPPGAELRGGAWVVIDGQINSEQVEMYADTTARGGVLEPEGIVEIKFRTPDLIAAMHRLDPVILKLKVEGGQESAIKARELLLLPVYRQVGNHAAVFLLQWVLDQLVCLVQVGMPHAVVICHWGLSSQHDIRLQKHKQNFVQQQGQKL
eukprot:jgi/Botrbrau1/22759/Bobra.0132s0090.2